MDDVKKTYRETEDKAKEVRRDADGHDVGDDIGNAGDEVRKDLGNAGDDARRTGDPMTDDTIDPNRPRV